MTHTSQVLLPIALSASPSNIVSFVRSTLHGPPIRLVNIKPIQFQPINSPHIDRPNRCLERRMQVYSIHHIHSTNTTETMVCALRMEQIICQVLLCVQHVYGSNRWVYPHIGILNT